MKISQGKIIFICCLLMFTLASGAADTLKIHLTYKHKLDVTGHSTGKLVVNQKLYTPEGILFREMNFDENSGQLAGYVFYFYRNGRLFTQEYYNQADSLQYILKHEYDQDGNEILITKIVPEQQNLIAAEKTVQVYDKNRKLIQQKKYYDKMVGVLTKYQYSPTGFLLHEIRKTKPISKSLYREEAGSYTYAENRLSLVAVTGRDLSDKPYQYHEEYSYDDTGRLYAIKTFDAGNELKGTKIYQYLLGNIISLYEERDSDGITNALFEYEYKKHYMELGTQVSRYEDF
jgi:hypothetical protein